MARAKDGCRFRTIPLDTRTIGPLRDHRRRQLEERFAFGRDYVDVDLVFLDLKGTLFNPENQSNILGKEPVSTAANRLPGGSSEMPSDQPSCRY